MSRVTESPSPTPSTTLASPTIVTVKVIASPSTIPSGRRRPPVAPANSSAGRTGSTHGLSGGAGAGDQGEQDEEDHAVRFNAQRADRMNRCLTLGDAPDGGNLVRRGLSVVLHRQAALRSGAGALRARATRSRSCGARSSSTRRPAHVSEGTAAERLAAKYGMSLERAAQLHGEMTERAAAEGPRVPLRPRPRRQHVRRAPPDPPRRHLRAPGRRAGAADARVLHRGRGDRRPGDADPARRRGRRRRRGGARRARPATASPPTCARTSCSPRSSASRACRSSCSTAATASPARSRPTCSSRPSNVPGRGGYAPRA